MTLTVVCPRGPGAWDLPADLDGRLSALTSVDGVDPRPAWRGTADGATVVLTDAHDAAPRYSGPGTAGACVGALTRATGDSWRAVNGNRPDGAFACVRADGRAVELATDVFGSRTLWYVFTDRLFAASTSQRVLVALLGSFEPDPQAASWMVWSGTLGPEASWDARVQKAPADAVVRLDRAGWRLRTDVGDVRFEGDGRSRDRWRTDLLEAVERSVRAFDLDPARWPVTLSGGADSRGIAAVLSRAGEWRTATWGDGCALDEPASDAAVARRLARAFGLDHEFYPVAADLGSVEDVLRRFVETGEARLDHFPGVAGPLRALREAGAWGVVRGDKVFGSSTAYSARHARLRVGLSVPSDVVAHPPGADGLAPIEVPPDLRPRPGEALPDYRDRVYTRFLLPSVAAALTTQKDPYLDTVNPYVTRDLAEVVRRMPAAFRTDKSLFREVVAGYAEVPFASCSPGPTLRETLSGSAVSGYVAERLGASGAVGALPSRLLDALARPTDAPASPTRTARSRPLRAAVRRFGVHRFGAALYAARGRARTDLTRTAFRAALVVEAHGVFGGDAEAFRRPTPGPPPR